MPLVHVRKHPLLAYDVWRSMHKRCNDPNTNGYSNYGGRGIQVAESWNSYEKFIQDMGPRPSPKHQLDRINPNLGYSLENCRWATAKENGSNRRNNRFIEWEGHRKTLTEWASSLGISISTLAARLSKWPLEQALTQPRGPTGPKRS